MDSFTENMLARARERQRLLNEYSGNEDKTSPLRECNSENNLKTSQTSLNELKNNNRKEASSDTHLAIKSNQNNGNIKENVHKFVRQTSKTRVSSEIPGSPQAQLKTLNIQRDNINMEIKVTSSENIRVEVEIEEGSLDSDSGSVSSENGLREDAKKRLNRLGKLYAGGDDAGISSPIHRTEAKFCQEPEGETTKPKNPKHRKGLSKLADLVSNMNEWEDDLNHAAKPTELQKSPEKKMWKPQPSQKSVDSPSKSQKGKAPQPPVSSPAKPKIVETGTPKQLKWDKAVLDTLESQGFTRTTSNSKLVYSYNSQDDKAKIASSKTNETKPETIPEEPTKIEKPSPVTPRSPIKHKSGVVAGRAALFESPATNSPTKVTKDPALMSVSERKALFEKNKGAALVPKAAFGMATPVENKTPAKTTVAPKVQPPSDNVLSPKRNKYPAPKPPPVVSPAVHTSHAVTTGGIASKMAALLEGKATISEEQIANNIREQRQKEMDLLLNRFNKNKEVVQPDEENLSDDENDATEETAMLGDKKTVRITSTKQHMPPPPPPPVVQNDQTQSDVRKSGGKRNSNSSDSAIVTAVLEEVKRIKVSPPKAGKLYPNLSDIEATTETETQTGSPDDSRNNSYGSLCDSDDPNTSFGRDILAAVCKNQTPHKRPIYDESTASDISSVLDEMNEYLDDIVEDSVSAGPTPPKHGRQSTNHNTATSHSFNYKHFSPQVKSPKSSQFKSPMKVPSPRKSLEQQTYVVDGDSVLPLTHTVSFYRKQQTQASRTPIRQITRQPLIEEPTIETLKTDREEVDKKIKELQDEVNKQEMIISQTSQALNLCNNTPEFSGSTEQVEAERVLLVSTHRRQAALHEIQRMKVERTIRPQGEHAQNLPLEKGTLTISNIVLPLKQKYVTALAATGGKGHHVVCLIKCGEQVVPTKLVSTVASSKKNPDVDLYVPGTIKLENIYSDFTVTFEVYCLQAHEEFLPHEVKYHINNKKPSSKMTPKKGKQDSRLQRPIKESPAGPHAVRSTSFSLMGYVVFSVQAVSKKHWALNNTPSMSPLEGSVEMKINCDLAVSVEQRGFLTMFEDVSGFGAWHRRWCLLQGHSLSYWKYPDDEKKTPPIDTINLKNCITKQVGPVSRDICARLHTLLIERERQAYPQDKDTLVMVRKGDKTIIRHLLSADTKEERIEWCAKFNAALTALRMWGNSE